MTPEKQIELVNDTMLRLNRDNATSDDVAKLFSKALEAIKAVKGQLEDKIATNHSTISDTAQGLLDEINTLSAKVNTITTELPQTKEKINGEMDKVVVEIYKEVKRIEQLIDGIKGEDGERGSKIFNIKTFKDAPKDAIMGDIIIVEDTNETYIYE